MSNENTAETIEDDSHSSITQLPAWKALAHHKSDQETLSIADLFERSEDRFSEFSVELDGLLFDYSKHRITTETMGLLFDLANARGVERMRERMFNGEHINNSEDRAVLHTALRGSVAKSLMVDGENVSQFVQETLAQIKEISDEIRSNDLITDVVNIGVGGSDLGARLVCDALHDYADGPNAHFLANIDGHRISRFLNTLDPKTTLFIVSSKSFSTLETMTNANTIRDWFIREYKEEAIEKHFYAVSNNIEAAAEFGIPESNILPLRDWVGGRYSVWGAIGLPIAISLGFERFQAFLNGANAVDTHFKEAPFEQNIPVIMALLGIWYHNFHGSTAHCISPYTQVLQRLPSYIQQLDMESNGKGVTRDGETVDYSTGPVIFGEPGTNGQHAYFQLLHQGTQLIPCDFIAAVNPMHDLDIHHIHLLSNALAQADAFAKGSQNKDEPHRNFEGNRPSSMLMLEHIDAYHLGMLMALYEHKVFVQGVIWDINSFDQWGVELGKIMATPIMESLQSADKQTIDKNFGSSTASLIHHILEKFIKS